MLVDNEDTPPTIEDKRYMSGLARYMSLEKEKWTEVVKTPCKARQDNEWVKNTCRITDNNCCHTDCFALQVIKHSKGFL